MNTNSSIEDQLQALGTILRARPSHAGRLMAELRKIADQDLASLAPASTRPRARHRVVTRVACAALAITVILLLVLVLPPAPSVGWAQVTEAIGSKTWIRGRVTYADGKKGTMWVSPERRIWAFQLDPSVYFFDGKEQVKYEYRGGDGPITKLPLGEDDAQRVLPIDALSRDQDAIGSWLFGSEKITQQERRELKESGKLWIEFHLTLFRGELNRAIMRVDPATKLPVHVLFSSPTDKSQVSKCEFDYPNDGPHDAYAAGVRRGIAIDDRMPSAVGSELLRKMAASRAKVGDFRLVVGHPSNVVGAVAVHPGSVVSRKGNRWRVDRCLPPAVPDWSQPADGQDWGEWAEEQLRNTIVLPLFVFDGKTIWENANSSPEEEPRWKVAQYVSPQDLMSGEGLGNLSRAPYAKVTSLIYPDLSPRLGWTFEVDPMPTEAPGCVLVKRSASLSSPEPLVGHEWYYVDPAKGHAVVRAELFTLAPGQPAVPENSKSRQSILMDGFHKSPWDWWYCTVITDMKAPHPGDKKPTKTNVRYSFDFKMVLPDSLFSVDGK